jgi:hypothetical protein
LFSLSEFLIGEKAGSSIRVETIVIKRESKLEEAIGSELMGAIEEKIFFKIFKG